MSHLILYSHIAFDFLTPTYLGESGLVCILMDLIWFLRYLKAKKVQELTSSLDLQFFYSQFFITGGPRYSWGLRSREVQ